MNVIFSPPWSRLFVWTLELVDFGYDIPPLHKTGPSLGTLEVHGESTVWEQTHENQGAWNQGEKEKTLKIWLLEGRRWYKIMTCFNDPSCIWYGVWGFYLKMDAGCFLVRFGCNPLRFNEMFVFLNLGIMMLNLSEKIYVLFYPCLFPAVFGIPIDVKEPCPNYDGYDRFSFFLHFFNLYDVDFGG